MGCIVSLARSVCTVVYTVPIYICTSVEFIFSPLCTISLTFFPNVREKALQASKNRTIVISRCRHTFIFVLHFFLVGQRLTLFFLPFHHHIRDQHFPFILLEPHEWPWSPSHLRIQQLKNWKVSIYISNISSCNNHDSTGFSSSNVNELKMWDKKYFHFPFLFNLRGTP